MSFLFHADMSDRFILCTCYNFSPDCNFVSILFDFRITVPDYFRCCVCSVLYSVHIDFRILTVKLNSSGFCFEFSYNILLLFGVVEFTQIYLKSFILKNLREMLVLIIGCNLRREKKEENLEFSFLLHSLCVVHLNRVVKQKNQRTFNFSLKI